MKGPLIFITGLLIGFFSLWFLRPNNRTKSTSAPVVLNETISTLDVSLDGNIAGTAEQIPRLAYLYWLSRDELTEEQRARFDANVKIILMKHIDMFKKNMNDPLSLRAIQRDFTSDNERMEACEQAQGFNLKQFKLNTYLQYVESIQKFDTWANTKDW